jgi:amino acid efflux transporter
MDQAALRKTLTVLMFGVVVIGHGTGLLPLDLVFRMSAVNFVVGYAMSVLAYGVLFRKWWHRVLAVVALAPVIVVLAGFGWLLLYPGSLLAVGAVAHPLTHSRSVKY